MTPLTHVTVGAAIYQRTRSTGGGFLGVLLALPLAFASHYLLDAIPHFEMVPPPLRHYDFNFFIMLALVITGTLLGVLLMRWNREVGTILLLLFLWASLSTYSPLWTRIAVGAAALAYIAAGKSAAGVGYMLAGMAAGAPDFIPYSFHSLSALHYRMHFHTDLGVRLFLWFQHRPIPYWRTRLHDPYFLTGYALELLIEGTVFFFSIHALSRERLSPGQEAELRAPAEMAAGIEE